MSVFLSTRWLISLLFPHWKNYSIFISYVFDYYVHDKVNFLTKGAIKAILHSIISSYEAKETNSVCKQ
jgi:hypothetical protein